MTNDISKIRISNHALERFVERVRGKEGIDIAREVATNKERYEEQILKLFEHSKLVFTGKLDKDKNKSNYYIRNSSVLIERENCIITIYDLNFDFPKDVSEILIDRLTEAILELNVAIGEKKEENKNQMALIDTQRAEWNLEISRLEDKIALAKQEVKFLEDEKKLLGARTTELENERQKYANQLFGVNSYKTLK